MELSLSWGHIWKPIGGPAAAPNHRSRSLPAARRLLSAECRLVVGDQKVVKLACTGVRQALVEILLREDLNVPALFVFAAVGACDKRRLMKAAHRISLFG